MEKITLYKPIKHKPFKRFDIYRTVFIIGMLFYSHVGVSNEQSNSPENLSVEKSVASESSISPSTVSSQAKNSTFFPISIEFDYGAIFEDCVFGYRPFQDRDFEVRLLFGQSETSYGYLYRPAVFLTTKRSLEIRKYFKYGAYLGVEFADLVVDVDDTYYDNSTYGRIQYDRVAKGRALLLSTGISSTGNLYFGLNYSQSILFQIRDPDEHSGDDGIDDTSMGDLSISIGYRFFDLTNLWEIKK